MKVKIYSSLTLDREKSSSFLRATPSFAPHTSDVLPIYCDSKAKKGSARLGNYKVQERPIKYGATWCKQKITKVPSITTIFFKICLRNLSINFGLRRPKGKYKYRTQMTLLTSHVGEIFRINFQRIYNF